MLLCDTPLCNPPEADKKGGWGDFIKGQGFHGKVSAGFRKAPQGGANRWLAPTPTLHLEMHKKTPSPEGKGVFLFLKGERLYIVPSTPV